MAIEREEVGRRVVRGEGKRGMRGEGRRGGETETEREREVREATGKVGDKEG